MGELEYLDPMGQDYLDKLEHIRGAVAHHMYEEESDRFLDLKQIPGADQKRLTQRFREEFERYVGDNSVAGGNQSDVPRTGAGAPIPH